jgi:hypothetical protein
MDINRVAQVSPLLSAQKIASDVNVATVKLANDQIGAQGAAALALIQAIPQTDSCLGSHIDVRV